MRCKVVNEEENITSDEDESIDVSSNSQSLQATNIHDNVYTKSVVLEQFFLDSFS